MRVRIFRLLCRTRPVLFRTSRRRFHIRDIPPQRGARHRVAGEFPCEHSALHPRGFLWRGSPGGSNESDVDHGDRGVLSAARIWRSQSGGRSPSGAGALAHPVARRRRRSGDRRRCRRRLLARRASRRARVGCPPHFGGCRTPGNIPLGVRGRSRPRASASAECHGESVDARRQVPPRDDHHRSAAIVSHCELPAGRGSGARAHGAHWDPGVSSRHKARCAQTHSHRCRSWHRVFCLNGTGSGDCDLADRGHHGCPHGHNRSRGWRRCRRDFHGCAHCTRATWPASCLGGCRTAALACGVRRLQSQSLRLCAARRRGRAFRDAFSDSILFGTTSAPSSTR